MTSAADVRPVVVGVDGSQAALQAALWAMEDAIHREAPLRLVHVTGIPLEPSIPIDVYRPELHFGESALHAVSSAIEATGKTVKVETDIVWGSAAAALVEESRSAAMICVGSVGIGYLARRLLGSIAAELAENAHCTVVVVRHRTSSPAPTTPDWVVVGVDDRTDNELVVAQTLDEARLRGAPVLAVATWCDTAAGVSAEDLDDRVAKWRRRYPDVHIYPVSTRSGLPEFLEDNGTGYVQLVALGSADVTELQRIIGRHDRPFAPHTDCSVMVIR
ncbi:universal stress protein [Mycobacterium sp. 141]|uniref:universal stress protein n=1 Tax=Mycobacterium sp. 141 TaxID=1120797 RepID=UPI0003667AB5|nr:universal stress protein [Mycobacterium sp. 141]